MRIYGNRLIQTLPGSQIRPTTGKVRQALFNIWQGAILGLPLVRLMRWQWFYGS